MSDDPLVYAEEADLPPIPEGMFTYTMSKAGLYACDTCASVVTRTDVHSVWHWRLHLGNALTMSHFHTGSGVHSDRRIDGKTFNAHLRAIGSEPPPGDPDK